MTLPVQFTGDISLLPADLQPVCRGYGCRIGIHTVLPGEWLVDDRGLRVKTESEYRQWQAERRINEALDWAA